MADNTQSHTSIWEKMMAYFESESDQMEMLQNIDPSQIPGLSFMSMITYDGVPILPPVINPLRREEMLIYKRQSMMAESRLRAKSRQSLLEKVQKVMQEIEERHGKGLSSEATSLQTTSSIPETVPKSFEAQSDISDVKFESKSGLTSIEPDSGFSKATASSSSPLQNEIQAISSEAKDEEPTDSLLTPNNTRDQSFEESLENSDSENDLDESRDASQGILLLRKKLEDQSQESSSSGSGLVLSTEALSKPADSANFEHTVSDISKHVSANFVTEDPKTNENNNQDAPRRVDSVAKRLPTFLRIQESLARKLNSTGNQSSGVDLHASIDFSDVSASDNKTTPDTMSEFDNTVSIPTFSAANKPEDTNPLSETSRFEPVISQEVDLDTKPRDYTMTDLEQFVKGTQNRELSHEIPAIDTQDTHNVAIVPEVNDKKQDGAPVVAVNTEEVVEEDSTLVRNVVVASISTSNSLASGNTFGSDDMNKTVISQEESKNRNTSGTMQSEESTASQPETTQTSRTDSSSKPEVSTQESHEQTAASEQTTTSEQTSNSSGKDEQIVLKEVPQTPPRESNKENLNPKLTLLGKVAFNVDNTPDCTPHKGRVEQFFAEPSPDTWICKVSADDKYPLENMDPIKGMSLLQAHHTSILEHSPGPSKTPNLSEISYADSIDPGLNQHTQEEHIEVKNVIDEGVTSDESQSPRKKPVAISDPFVQSLETHDLYTESTELAQYMATSLDTDPSGASTLPHGGSDRKISENIYPAGADSNLTDAKQMNLLSALSGSKLANIEVTPDLYTAKEFSPGLRGSYTLDQPSPALMHSNAQDVSLNEVHDKPSPGKGAKAELAKSELTNSMEDLNIRPVHRKLEYQPNQETNMNKFDTQGSENLIITPLPDDDEAEKVPPNRPLPNIAQGQPQGQTQHFDVQMPFDVMQQDQREAERHGKQEHLQRYLNNLTHVPIGPARGQNWHPGASPGEVGIEEDDDGPELEADTRHISDDFSDEGFENEPSEENLLTMQHLAFEKQRERLMEEHRLQLMQLMSEQQNQQQQVQQQLLRASQQNRKSQEKRTKSRKSRRSLDTSQHTHQQSSQPPLDPRLPTSQTSQPRHDSNMPTSQPRPQSEMMTSQSHRKSEMVTSQTRPESGMSSMSQPPPSVNQNQLLASLAQLLGQQALGLNQPDPQNSMQNGLPTTSGLQAIASAVNNVHQSMTNNSQQGYHSMPFSVNNTMSQSTKSHTSTRQSQQHQSMSHNEYASYVNNTTSPPQYRPDSQMSDAHTLTSQDVYNRQTDGTISQASTLNQDYMQRPYTAPLPNINHSVDAGIQSPGARPGMNFSPTSIANLCHTLLNMSQNPAANNYTNQQQSPYHQRHHNDSFNSPASGHHRYTHESPSHGYSQHHTDTSMQSSERSVHFASPLQQQMGGGTYEQSPHHQRHLAANGDTSLNYSYQHQQQHYQPQYLPQEIPYERRQQFIKITAMVKGYLVRRLMKTEKVQGIIKSISDTADFALKFTQESPIKRGVYSEQDRRLQERVMQQLTANICEIHDIFFRIPVRERMEIIQIDRQAIRERMFKAQTHHMANEKRLSAASVKTIERKQKAMLGEASVPQTSRPKSAPPPSTTRHKNTDERALKPLQARTTPIKPIKATNRVQHKDPNIRTAPRKTHVQTRPQSTNKAKSKTAVTSTAAKKTSAPATKQPIRKIARPTTQQHSDTQHNIRPNTRPNTS